MCPESLCACCRKLDGFISFTEVNVQSVNTRAEKCALPGRQHERIGAGATEVRGGKGEVHAGNSLKIERRKIEGKCGRTIATEPRVSDGPAGIVISILLLRNVPDSSPMEIGVVSLSRDRSRSRDWKRRLFGR